jgi:hypothetical protein
MWFIKQILWEILYNPRSYIVIVNDIYKSKMDFLKACFNGIKGSFLWLSISDYGIIKLEIIVEGYGTIFRSFKKGSCPETEYLCGYTRYDNVHVTLSPRVLPWGVAQSWNKFTILNLNFQGIKNKKVDTLNITDSYNPDIIIGIETWLNDSVHNSEIFRPNYNIYRRDQRDGFGGVVIAVKADIVSDPTSMLRSIQNRSTLQSH